jgi:hypothetical protein
MPRMACWAVLAATFAGCAGLDAVGCRSADWRDRGYREGLFGNPPHIEVYAEQCRRHGVEPDAARYGEGWDAGHLDWGNRTFDGGAD